MNEIQGRQGASEMDNGLGIEEYCLIQDSMLFELEREATGQYFKGYLALKPFI